MPWTAPYNYIRRYEDKSWWLTWFSFSSWEEKQGSNICVCVANPSSFHSSIVLKIVVHLQHNLHCQALASWWMPSHLISGSSTDKTLGCSSSRKLETSSCKEAMHLLCRMHSAYQMHYMVYQLHDHYWVIELLTYSSTKRSTTKYEGKIWTFEIGKFQCKTNLKQTVAKNCKTSEGFNRLSLQNPQNKLEWTYNTNAKMAINVIISSTAISDFNYTPLFKTVELRRLQCIF